MKKKRHINYKGERFGRWLLLEKVSSKRWLCQCDCGMIKSVSSAELNRGNTRSCGCLKRELTSIRNKKDITGQRFGRLIAIKRLYINKHHKSMWECRCDCGNKINTTVGDLRSGNTQSCGCYCIDRVKEVKTTHGLSQLPIYNKIKHAKRRDKKKKFDAGWTNDMGAVIHVLMTNCILCGMSEKEHLEKYNEHLHLDHVRPLSKGYGLKPGNAVMLCSECNWYKYEKMPCELPAKEYYKIANGALFYKRVWESLQPCR